MTRTYSFNRQCFAANKKFEKQPEKSFDEVDDDKEEIEEEKESHLLAI